MVSQGSGDEKRTVLERTNGQAVVIRDLRTHVETRVVCRFPRGKLEIFHGPETAVVRAELLDLPESTNAPLNR